MANPNTQDILLRIQTAVDGLQDVGKLLSEIDELGGDTSAASQDVERLNAQMQALGQQRSLISALEQTRERVADASQAMDEAEGQAGELRRAYEQTEQGVQAQRRAAQEAAEQAEVASTAYREQQRALQALQTQYKGVQQSTTGARQAWRDAAQRVKDLETAIEGSGEATADQARQLAEARGAADQARRSYEEQADSLSGLRDELQGQRQSVDQAKQSWEDYRDESRELNRELKDSERAFARQGKELDRAEQAAGKARTSFERQGKALEELSEDAREAGVDVDRLADEQQRLERESADLERGVDSLKGELRDYRQQVDGTEGSVRRLGRTLATGIKRFGAWTAAAAAGAAALSVGVLTRYTAAQAEAARQIDNTSEAIDVNAQRLQELQYAFDRVSIDADKTGDLLKDVADKIGDAYTNGGGEAKDAIDALGLSLDELIGLRPDEQLLAIAGALDQLPQASQVNVMESLANDASLLLPLLRDNAAGLRELTDEAKEIGVIMTPEQIANLKATNDAIQRLQGRLQNLRNRVIGEVSPAVNDLAGSFDDLLKDNPGLVDDLSQVFRGLIQTTQRWMEYVITNRERVGAALQSLIDTAQFLGNSFVAAFRATQSAAAGVLAVVADVSAKIFANIERVTSVLNTLGLVTDEAMARATARTDALREASRELAAQAAEYGRQAIQAGKDAVNAFDNTGAAARRAAEETKKANEEAKKQFEAEFEAAAEAATAAALHAERIAALQGQIAATKAELERYQQQLRDDPSTETAQKVGELINRLGGLKGELQGVSREAGNNAKAMEAAADAIGLTLDELKTGVSEAAAGAIGGFETLVKSGQLSAEQLEDAFQATWDNLDSKEDREAFLESIRAMVDDGVDGAGQFLSAWQEAFQALGDESSDAAKGIKESLDELKTANEETAQAIGDNRTEIGELREEIGESTEATNNAIISWQQWAEAMENGLQVSQLVADGVAKWKEEQLEAGVATDEHTAAILRQREEMERAREETEQLNASLERQVAQMREQLAQLRGDQEAVQQMRYERERLQLEEQLQQARELGDANAIQNARQLLSLQREAYQLEQQQAREQQSQSARPQASNPASAPAVANPAQQVAQATRAVRITLDTGQGTAQLTADSERDEQLLLDALGRDARRTTH